MNLLFIETEYSKEPYQCIFREIDTKYHIYLMLVGGKKPNNEAILSRRRGQVQGRAETTNIISKHSFAPIAYQPQKLHMGQILLIRDKNIM